jgi:prevent-host-death family protein
MTSLEKGSSPARRGRGARGARHASWQLQDAKARFSEVVRRAKQEGPQHVTVHGREEVVVVGAEDFRKLAGEQTGKVLIDAMQQSPHRSTTLEPSRSRMRVRGVEL